MSGNLRVPMLKITQLPKILINLGELYEDRIPESGSLNSERLNIEFHKMEMLRSW